MTLDVTLDFHFKLFCEFWSVLISCDKVHVYLMGCFFLYQEGLKCAILPIVHASWGLFGEQIALQLQLSPICNLVLRFSIHTRLNCIVIVSLCGTTTHWKIIFFKKLRTPKALDKAFFCHDYHIIPWPIINQQKSAKDQ